MNKLFLYHMVPVDMQGSILYPLNTLKQINPELYETKSAKYIGREVAKEWRILTLNAAWNDVLHLAAVPPKDLKEVLVEAGMENIPLRCYQIDPESLDTDQITVYLYSTLFGDEGPSPADFVPFDLQDMENYSGIPEAAKANYRKMCAEGKRPLAFAGIPHILYRGMIDTEGLPVVRA